MQVSNPHESVISDIYCGTYGTESLFSLIFFIENHVKLHSVHLNDDQDITTAVTVAVGNAAVLHMLPCVPRHHLRPCQRPHAPPLHMLPCAPHAPPPTAQPPPAGAPAVLCTARAFFPKKARAQATPTLEIIEECPGECNSETKQLVHLIKDLWRNERSTP